MAKTATKSPDMMLKEELGGELVLVQMLTYNHEQFIRKAVESVVNQKTNFKFRLLLGEDCSTDRTREICTALKQEYPDKISLVLNERNIGVARNAKLHHQLCYDSGVRYVAVCEGDDYWTDPLKLQKQVDFLEQNEDHNICWTRYALDTEKGIVELDWSYPIFQHDYTPITVENIFEVSRTYPITVMWRRSSVPFDLLNEFQHSKDITFYCIALSTGKGALLNFSGANYRLHGGGSYSAAGDFGQNYNNFLSLQEIVSKIPHCDIPIVHSKMMYSLERALYAACNQRMDAKAYRQVRKTLRALIAEAPLNKKVVGVQELIKQSLRRIKYIASPQ